MYFFSRNIQLFNYQSKLSNGNSSIEDLFLRTNRAVSVEPNLIAGGNDMKMNNGHCRHYLIQQKSLPNEFTSSETIDQSM
jgi:hypothetical protein